MNNIGIRPNPGSEAGPNPGSGARPTLGSRIGPNQGFRTRPTPTFGVGTYMQQAGAQPLVNQSRQVGPTLVIQRVTPQIEERWHLLEERLRVVEGTNCYNLDAADLCLVPDVGLLADFKTPKFDKYKGSSCPWLHLAMYCRKMTAYVHDDKILDMAPDCSWLQNMSKREHEGFKEYAQRWRELATQLQPPLIEK
ncbi:hypothetical protein CR513_03795, partial [Mucuna pruriens]